MSMLWATLESEIGAFVARNIGHADQKNERNSIPNIETRDKNSSYILRFRIVDPINILRYESLSMPHNLTLVLARTVAARGVP